jgi:hypothetical protein
MQATVGTIYGDAQLSATGTSVAPCSAPRTAKSRAWSTRVRSARCCSRKMGLNVGNIIVTKLFGDKQVQLNCLAADFDVNKGVMQTQHLRRRHGRSDHPRQRLGEPGNEQMDLHHQARNEGAAPVHAARAALRARPFSKPDVSLDKGVLALKAGGAAVLAVVAAPVAALLPLINTGPGENSDCAAWSRWPGRSRPPRRRARRKCADEQPAHSVCCRTDSSVRPT